LGVLAGDHIKSVSDLDIPLVGIGLFSDVEGNAPLDRELTSQLYGGDARTRIRQELFLGVGGFRALKAMGITPSVVHMNEGHSGFAVIEAIRNRMEDEGVGFDQAVPRVSRQIVFTTHTPVPAGSFCPRRRCLAE
jgi:starch phosphorylase